MSDPILNGLVSFIAVMLIWIHLQLFRIATALEKLNNGGGDE